MNKILFVTTTKYPKHRADYFQALMTANALAGHGRVTFITQKDIPDVVFFDYGISKNDQLLIKTIPFNSFFQKMLFVIRLLFLASLGGYDFIYTREPRLAQLIGFFSIKLLIEVHDIDDSIKMIPRRSRIVAITHSLKKNLIKEFGFDEKDIIVAPDGVIIGNFDIPLSKVEAREELNITGDKIIMYAGVFHPWKGAHILAEAAKELPTFQFIFVGGERKDIPQQFLEKFSASNIRIEGIKPHRQIPYYLKAADILVLPNSACDDISIYYTSPIKLFEYLASKRPIVASDLPSIREVLNEKCSTFFKPDDPVSLAAEIKSLASSKRRMDELAANGFEMVRKYSWRSRANSIIEFMKNFRA